MSRFLALTILLSSVGQADQINAEWAYLSGTTLAPIAATHLPRRQISVPFSAVRGGFIALSVADADASAKGYADKLSLAIIRQRSQSPDRKAFTTVLAGNGLIVLIDARVVDAFRKAAAGFGVGANACQLAWLFDI